MEAISWTAKTEGGKEREEERDGRQKVTREETKWLLWAIGAKLCKCEMNTEHNVKRTDWE